MPIDFTWFYFIGRNKLGLTFKEVGRLTLRTFNKLYQHYKNDFDKELMLNKSRTTYQKYEEEQIENEEWF